MSHHDPDLARQLAVTLATMRPAAPRAKDLRRPRLLVEAARHAARDWRQGRDLPRLLGPTPPADPLPRLLEAEARQNDLRRQRHYGWSMQRQILLLAAIIAECDNHDDMALDNVIILRTPASV